MQIVGELAINAAYVKTVRNLYEDIVGYVRVEKKLLKEFRVRKGLKQGYCFEFYLKFMLMRVW